MLGAPPFSKCALGAPGGDTGVLLPHGYGLRDGHTAAYVCRGFAHQVPVIEPEGLATRPGQR